MQKHTKKHNIKRKILSALITSAISAATLNPLAFALPVQEGDMTAGVNIAPSSDNLQMDISGAADNNVINWSKFNIAQNETVAFDAKNYLNLINDSEMSEIWGTLKGDGSIYLINPNGILFGKGATVDVGTLYASTRNISDDLKAEFESYGDIPILSSTATGDIINMGTLKAAQSITLEGNNIVIESNDNDNGIIGITAATDGEIYFVVNAGGSVQVGAVSGDDTDGYKITTGEHQSGTIYNNDDTNNNTPTYFKLVRTLDELQAINDDVNNDVSNNYMLAGNIDGSTSENFTPIGTEDSNFTGRFNGLNYSINDLVINKPDPDDFEVVQFDIGLFGSVGNGGIVEYVKRNGGSTTGAGRVGGIVGSSFGGKIRNVYNESAVTSSGDAGGIVGYMEEAGSIENAINAGNISNKDGYLGGIVGYIEGSGITVQNVINKGSVTSTPDDSDAENIGGVIGYVFLCDNSANTFENLKNEGTVSSAQGKSINVGGVFGTLHSLNAQNTVKNIKNEANVSGTDYVGGIVGNLIDTTIENVKNEGTVTANGGESFGQIVGYNDGGNTEGEYNNSWEAVTDIASTPFGPYTPLNTTSPSGGGSSSGESTTPTSTDTDTSSGDDSSTDTDTTPTIPTTPTTPTTPTVPLTPTTPTTPTAPTTPTSETTTPVEETTPQTPTVEPTVAPTSAETEPVAPVIEPKTEPVSPTVTQTATTTLEEVLQSVGKKQEGGNNPAENITMKTLTEAENAAAANAQTATNSPAINSAAQIPQTSTNTVTTTTTISTSSDSSTTSTPSKQSAPSVSTTSTRNTSSASSDNNASANATIITDDKLSIVNQGENMPASMSVDAVVAQESKSANAANTADTTQSVETSQNGEDKNEQ